MQSKREQRRRMLVCLITLGRPQLVHQTLLSARQTLLCDVLRRIRISHQSQTKAANTSHRVTEAHSTYTSSHSQQCVMRATLLFALLACARAYQLPRSRRSLVVPPRRYDLQPRSAPDEATTDEADAADEAPAAPSKPARYDASKLVDSSGPGFNQFDPVLTATRGLSRRFGLAGGLAIFGILLVVEGGEIIKAVGTQEPVAGSTEEVTLPSGLKYTESLIGRAGDAVSLPGSVIGLAIRVSIGDKVIFDSTGGKGVAFKLGQRPFQNVLCEGVEQGIKGMKTGGKRRLLVPKALAPPGVDVPDGVSLVYDVEVKEVLPGYF